MIPPMTKSPQKPNPQILKSALYFLKFRPRSETELRHYLARKFSDSQNIEPVLNKLKQLNFINDQDFVAWWVRRRDSYRPRSARIVALELKRKGIDQQLIKDLVPADKSAELRRAKKAALKAPPDRQKFIAYLSRRGFSWDTIKAVVKPQ